MWQGGSLTVHGSLNVDSRTLIDGMVADAMFAGGQCACVYDNEAQTQEIAVQVSAGSAENQLSGVLVNRIPRTGGNTLSAELLTNFSNNDLASQNLDDELIARGLPTPAELYKQYDINYTSMQEGTSASVITYVVAPARGYHGNAVHVLLMDGSTRSVADSVSLATWQALGTRAGGEVVGEF